MLQGDLSYENENFTNAFKKYMQIYENYTVFIFSFRKAKKTYERPLKKVFSFMKNMSNIGNQMELYSSLNKEYINSISNDEIANL